MRLVLSVGALALVVVLSGAGCGKSPSAPIVPVSPAPPTYPSGKPNATAFENLELVRAMERASGRESNLVLVAGGATVDGRLWGSLAWRYQFAEVVGNSVKLYEWNVEQSGEIRFAGLRSNTSRLGSGEIGPFLLIDSPEAIRLGRQYGAGPLVEQYPQAFVEVGYKYLGGPTCEMRFYTSPSGRPCPSASAWIYISSVTGQLITRDLTCAPR